MISYADLEKARAERMKKDAAKENRRRGKRSRKLEVDSAEADAERPAGKKMRFAAVPEQARASEDISVPHATETVPEPWRAPVARMW